MNTVKIVPVPGRVILMPDRGFKPVPDEGVVVERTSFYTRAIAQGDIAVAPEPVANTEPGLFDAVVSESEPDNAGAAKTSKGSK